MDTQALIIDPRKEEYNKDYLFYGLQGEIMG